MRKKVLFLTAFLPHPGAAAEKNTMLMIEEFSREFDVDLVYFKYAEEKDYSAPANVNVFKVYKNSRRKKIANILSFPFVHPLFSVRFNKGILKDLNALVANKHFDAIVCEHSQMFLFAKYLKTTSPIFVYCHDVMIQRVGRTSNWIISWFCKKSEEFCLNIKNATFYSVSQKDCNILNQNYDINAHPCLAYVASDVVNAKVDTISNNFVFMGKWSRADNLDGVVYFFEKVAPLVDYDINVSIVGKNFPIDKITNSNPHVHIHNLGFVDNPYPLIANAKAMISPLFTGAGTKQKVFESLACGTPVIGTDIAFEGIDTRFSNFMMLCEKPEDYINAMKYVCMNKDERLTFKNDFINAYKSKTMPQYVKEKLGM